MKSTPEYFSEDSERFATNYSCKHSFKDRLNLIRTAVQRLAPVRAKVLDFGCGPGVIASAVSAMGYDVLGTDVSEGMVRRSRFAAAVGGQGNLRFELMDATNTGFASQSFDVIICSSVLEYLVQDMAILEQLVHSLKLGGVLLVSVPNAWSLIGIAECSLRKFRRFCRVDIGRHFDYSLRHYSATRFVARLSSLGLEVQRRTSFEFPLCGKAGIALSRRRSLGSMILFEARRNRLV